MAATPATPDNPFNGGGAEQNIDAQKALLNNLIANQGQGGRALYERQAPEAQAMLNDRLSAAGTVPTARQAVYDAFTRDARAAEQQQANTIARQGQIGQLFMDQAKAAVPIYSKNVDLASQAMRQQFEERQAAQAASRASSRTPLTGAALGEEQAAQEIAKQKALDAAGLGKGASAQTIESATKAGTSQPAKSFDESVKQLNLPPWQALKQLDPGLEKDMYRIQTAINGMAMKKGTQALSWDDVYTIIQNSALADDLESSTSNRSVLVDIALAANAPRWGVTDPREWNYDPTVHDTLRANYGRSMGRNILAGPGQTGVAGG